MREANAASEEHYSYVPASQLGVHTYLKLEENYRAEQMIKRLQKSSFEWRWRIAVTFRISPRRAF